MQSLTNEKACTSYIWKYLKHNPVLQVHMFLNPLTHKNYQSLVHDSTVTRTACIAQEGHRSSLGQHVTLASIRVSVNIYVSIFYSDIRFA
jgi:hypothetical protein